MTASNPCRVQQHITHSMKKSLTDSNSLLHEIPSRVASLHSNTFSPKNEQPPSPPKKKKKGHTTFQWSDACEFLHAVKSSCTSYLNYRNSPLLPLPVNASALPACSVPPTPPTNPGIRLQAPTGLLSKMFAHHSPKSSRKHVLL